MKTNREVNMRNAMSAAAVSAIVGNALTPQFVIRQRCSPGGAAIYYTPEHPRDYRYWGQFKNAAGITHGLVTDDNLEALLTAMREKFEITAHEIIYLETHD